MDITKYYQFDDFTASDKCKVLLFVTDQVLLLIIQSTNQVKHFIHLPLLAYWQSWSLTGPVIGLRYTEST